MLSAFETEGPAEASAVLGVTRPDLGEDEEEPGFLAKFAALAIARACSS